MEMSSFPSLLLILTLFRLSLNVASTKLILLNGFAGSVINAFGQFVIGNNYIVGTVVFLILVMINFMVITKGAGRIAEVAARFTLDALPGKQMSIDADLNAGLIDETDAKDRRKQLNNEAEFYGAMDGASKFVKGDAVAGLVITVINILGGLAIGVFQQNMDVVDALQTYTILTIGDGLVSQIPALLISIAAGVLVAKTASTDSMGGHFAYELLRRKEPLYICSVMLMFLAFLPGFPFLPFAILSILCFFLAFYVSKELILSESGSVQLLSGEHSAGDDDTKRLGSPQATAENAESDDSLIQAVTPMLLEIGFSLVPLVDQDKDGDLVERIGLIRKQIREEMGFLIPPIAIQDNIELNNNEYKIHVRGLERAVWSIHPGSSLAIDPGDTSGQIEGIRTIDPAFGFEAIWINPERQDVAESMGYTVVDTASVITTHVTKIVKDYAADLLSRQDTKNLIENFKESNSTVVEELIPNQLSIGAVHRVLQYLLKEKVPIHDLASILETLSDYSTQSKDPLILSEFCRQELKGHILSSYLSETGTLYAMTLVPELEEEIRKSIEESATGGAISLAPHRASSIIDQIQQTHEGLRQTMDVDIILLVSPMVRNHLFQLVHRRLPELPVISYAEITDDIKLKILGTIKCEIPEEELATV